MIAACPKCGARYRVDASRLRPEGSGIRCSGCGAAFRVRPPAPKASAPVSAPGASDGSGQPVSPPGGANVVIADSNVGVGQALANTLVAWGLRPLLVHDGVDAVLSVQRVLPALVILEADLPKMSGLQVCELIKRNASLQQIRVVLIGAAQNAGRNGQPQELYGPDAQIGRPQLPAALRPVVDELGLAAQATPVAPPPPPPVVAAPASTPEVSMPPEVPSALPPAPTPPVASSPAPPPAAAVSPAPAEIEPDDGVAEAQRLARVIVADIVLYNEAKFDAAIATGKPVEALAAEITEGRAHFNQRIDASVRDKSDFLAEEILRVARSRGKS